MMLVWIIGAVLTGVVIGVAYWAYTKWENNSQAMAAIIRNFFIMAKCPFVANIMDDLIIGRRRRAFTALKSMVDEDRANTDILIEKIIKPLHTYGEQLILEGLMEAPTVIAVKRVVTTAAPVAVEVKSTDKG